MTHLPLALRPILMGAFFAATVGGCLGSEVGNPPFNPESGGGSPFDADHIGFEIDPAAVGPFIISFPIDVLGAADEVTVTNLSGTMAALPLRIEGEFWEVSVTADDGDTLRMSALQGGDWSVPGDFLVREDALVPVTAPACLEWERRSLRAGDSARVRNGCDVSIDVAASTRRGIWTVSPLNVTLAPNAVAAFELTPVPGQEDTLRVESDGDTVHFSLRP